MLPYFGLLPTHLEITKKQPRSTWQRWQRVRPSNQHHAPIRLGIASTASLTQHVIIYHHLTEEWSPVLCNVAKTTKPILNAFTTWKLWVFLQLNSFNSKEQNIIITCYQNHHRHSCGCLGSFRHSFLSLIFHCQCKLTQTFFYSAHNYLEWCTFVDNLLRGPLTVACRLKCMLSSVILGRSPLEAPSPSWHHPPKLPILRNVTPMFNNGKLSIPRQVAVFTRGVSIRVDAGACRHVTA